MIIKIKVLIIFQKGGELEKNRRTNGYSYFRWKDWVA